jgi:CHAT domain-containing protein
MIFRPCCWIALQGIALTALFGQTQADVQPLWDELSTKWIAGDLVGAEAAADQILQVLDPVKTDFSLGIQVNSAIHNRASFRFNRGDYAGAEADLIRSVAQARAILPPAGLPEQAIAPMMAMVEDRVRLSLRGLTNFYLAAGDLERATASFEEAIALVPLWQRQGAQDPGMAYQVLAAEVSSFEGSFYRGSGDFTKAIEAYLSRLEEIDQAWAKVLELNGGIESDFTDQLKMNYLRGRSNLLMELAETSVLVEKFEEALGFSQTARESANEMFPLYQKWAETTLRTNPAMPRETIEKTLAGVATSMNYLRYERAALVYRAAGDDKSALEAMLEGLAQRGPDFQQQRMLTLEYNVIRPEESLTLIGDLQALVGKPVEAAASYAQAKELILSQYPAGHPAILTVRESEAIVAMMQGDAAGAEAIAREVAASRLQHLSDVLDFASEPQRLAYRASVDPWSLLATLQKADPLYEVVLRTKGIVLESLLEDRGISKRATDPNLEKILLDLEVARRQLMESLLGGATTVTPEIAAQRQAIATLEALLAPGKKGLKQARVSLNTTVAQVKAALPKGATLIEFIRYRQFTAPGRSTARYGAIVLSEEAGPRFIDLDDAIKIEAGMKIYAKAMRSNPTDESMSQFLKTLGDSVWNPLAAVLPKPGAPLILSPDGALNFLSFATLLHADGRFVGEVWPLSYVSSGRDLLREVKSERKRSIEIIANPDYETPTHEAVADADLPDDGAVVSMRGILSRIGLSPLPGTKAEEEALRAVIEQEWKWVYQSHLESSATEEVVNAMESPAILHLATHGFYLPQTGRSNALDRGQRYWEIGQRGAGAAGPSLESFSDVVLDNPMHRSGVALAGAQATLREWGAGRIHDTANDGILTAAEMSLLDLTQTWLVILSACETGLGETTSGEGVLGMRRGLIQAGAQNLLLTLWPVSDRETAAFMVDFYHSLDQGKAVPREIMPAVQARYLQKFRVERGVTTAAKQAGPFILSFQQ